MTYPKDIEMILTNAAQNQMIEPYSGAFVSDMEDEAKDGLPYNTVYVLAFDDWKAAVHVAKEAKRMCDQRRKLRAHVCTGHGQFSGLWIATLI